MQNHVSKGAKDKKLLMRVFEAVKEAEAKKAAKTHGQRALTVKQRINSKTFLVSAGGTADYWFLALEPKDLNNRDRFRVDAVLTDRTKTFRNENGEDVKVRVLQEVKSDPLPTLTKEEFVKRLKAGETWTLVEFAEAKCQKCGGDGRVGELEHAGGPLLRFGAEDRLRIVEPGVEDAGEDEEHHPRTHGGDDEEERQ